MRKFLALTPVRKFLEFDPMGKFAPCENFWDLPPCENFSLLTPCENFQTLQDCFNRALSHFIFTLQMVLPYLFRRPQAHSGARSSHQMGYTL